ncbi:MAG: TonB-dependent receptor [Pseudomonadota bacterium]
MQHSLRTRRFVGQSVAFLTTALGTALAAAPAIAQDDDGFFLEEIVVTATKVERNAQDIPVAVTAFTGDLLVESGIRDIRELSAIAPSLVANRSQTSTNASFSIRGIGTSSQNFGLESSVGLYIDGAFRSRQNSIINNLVDIEAVEVLRGPQGTLFGKNTPSGAISIRTIKPGHDANAFVELQAANRGYYNLSGATNISLIEDVLAARITAFGSERDGYVDDVFLGSDAVNDQDRYGGRLQFLYTPNDSLEVRVIADYAEIDEICCATLTRVSNVTAIDDPTRLGSDALLLAGGATVFSGDTFEDYTQATNFLPRSSNEDAGISVEINYDVGDTTWTSISAFRDFSSFDFIDADFSNAEILDDTNDAEQSSFSQEFRFARPIGERGNIVAGVYYFQQDLDNFSTLDLGNFTDTLLTADPDLAGLIAGINGVSAATGGLVPPAATAYPADAFARDDMRQEHESYAIFAQADWNLSERLVLTTGVRYTDEEKDIRGTFTNSPLGPPPDIDATVAALGAAAIGQPFDPAVFAPYAVPGWGLYTIAAISPRADVNETLEDDQVTGTLKLTFFPTDSSMVYASAATGFKSGGTNTDRIDPIFPVVFGAETSEAFEIGTKIDFDDQNLRLNIAAHVTNIDDLQANSFTGAGFNLQNAGSAETYGAEVELWWKPTQATDIQVALVHNVADFDEFLLGTCYVATPFHFNTPDPGQNDPNLPVCDRSGDRVPSNPEQTAFVMGRHEWRVADSTSAYVRGEMHYQSDTMTDGNNDPLKLRGAFTMYNLRVGFLFDEWDAELTLWGRNLTDERFFETVFDVPVQDGKLNAYPHEPRSYGVMFRKNFN